MKYQEFRDIGLAIGNLSLEIRPELMASVNRYLSKSNRAEIEKLEDYRNLYNLEDTEENYYRFTKQFDGIKFLVKMYRNIENRQELKRLRLKVSAGDI